MKRFSGKGLDTSLRLIAFLALGHISTGLAEAPVYADENLTPRGMAGPGLPATIPQASPVEQPPAPTASPVASVRVFPPAPPPALSGHLQVNVNAPAKIYIDGKYRGEASPGQPLNQPDLLPGMAEIVIEAPGYESRVEYAEIHAGEWTQLATRLRAETVLPPVTATFEPPVVSDPPPPQTRESRRFSNRRSPFHPGSR